ncbi:neuraminidase [Thozetella sp. PMI_491]|nr:neuraminidase [Thozetella sp. PMI_491]
MHAVRLVCATALLLLSHVTSPVAGLSIPGEYHALKRDLLSAPVTAKNAAYPRLATLSDGSILAAFTSFSGSTHNLVVQRSTDGGITYSPWGAIASGTGDLDNVFILEVPGSSPPKVLAAFRNHDKSGSTYTYYRITVTQSTDGGKTWSFLSTPVEGAPSATNLGYWEPFMRIGADGKVQLTYSGLLSGTNQETFRAVSSDGGATWTTPVNLHIHPTNVNIRDGMQGIVSVTDAADGRAALVMIMETTRRGIGIFSVEYAVSYDDGATYPNRGTVHVPTSTAHNAGAPQIAAVGNKGLVAIFMSDEDQSSTNWPTIASVKTVVSNGLSGGVVTWSESPAQLSPNPSAWPGLLQVNDTVFAVYGHSGISGFKLSWPTA